MINATNTHSFKTASIGPVLPNTSRTSLVVGVIGALLATGTLFAGPSYAHPSTPTVMTQSA